MLNSPLQDVKEAHLHSSLPSSRNTMQHKQDTAWEVYCAIILNKNEEMNVIQLADWREKTSMPIVRVKHYTIQKKQTYPKKCEIQIERIHKCFDKLKQIELHDTFYLLRQALMGYQTLAYKFGTYNISETICGVNERGQCRVWLSKDVSEVPYCKSAPLKPYDIVSFLMKKLILMTKDSQREKIRQLHLQIQTNQSISYGKLFSLIKDYTNKQKIVIPSYIKRERVHRSNFKKGEVFSERNIKNQSEKKNWETEKKMSLRSMSPLLNDIKSYSSTEKKIKPRPPKINWKYQCLNQSLDVQVCPSPSTPLTPATPWNIRGHSLSNYEFSPIHLSEELSPIKHNRFPKKKNITIKQFTMEEQIKEVANNPSSRNKIESPKTNHSNNSIWTTQMTDSSKDEQNFQKNTSKIKDSNESSLETSQKNERRNESPVNLKLSKTYDFGGLITVKDIDPNSIKKEEQQKKNYENDKKHKWENKFELEKKSRLIESFNSEKVNENEKEELESNDGYRSEFLDTVGNLDNFWSGKMINFLSESKGLKQSMHVGEETRAPHMQVKLQKLSRLGRDVTTSCCHQL